jgi:hypothetical protein
MVCQGMKSTFSEIHTKYNFAQTPNATKNREQGVKALPSVFISASAYPCRNAFAYENRTDTLL